MRPTIVQRRKHNALSRYEIVGGRFTRARILRLSGRPILP
jgi:hypothetical protein